MSRFFSSASPATHTFFDIFDRCTLNFSCQRLWRRNFLVKYKVYVCLSVLYYVFKLNTHYQKGKINYIINVSRTDQSLLSNKRNLLLKVIILIYYVQTLIYFRFLIKTTYIYIIYMYHLGLNHNIPF